MFIMYQRHDIVALTSDDRLSIKLRILVS